VLSRYAPCGKAAKVTCDQALFLPFLLEARGKGPSFTFAVVRRLSHSSEKIKRSLIATAGTVADHEEPQAVIFLHGIWRHIREFGIEGQIPRISSPVKLEKRG